MTQQQIEALIRDLTLLISVQEPGAMPENLDPDTYIFAYRTGARSAYMDMISRLRERPEITNVTRIGGGVA